jgi:hypothetical protein
VRIGNGAQARIQVDVYGEVVDALYQAHRGAASGVQQGAWVVNGYGIGPAERASFAAPPATEVSGKKCYYVLDVLLCD